MIKPNLKKLFKQKENMETQGKNVETEEKITMPEEKMENGETKEVEKKEKKLEKQAKKNTDKRSEQEMKLQEMGEKLAEINEKYLRLYSEYENYRKRTAKEKSDLLKYGGEEMIKAILPIVDDFERAIQAFDKNEDSEALKEGVLLIYNKLMNTLHQKGVKIIEAKGEKFDENLHEAVTQFPAGSEEEKGKVIEELSRGYYLNDKVIRYAKVVVAI